MRWNKIRVDKVTHEYVHEKLDSIEIEGYTSRLGDPNHLMRPKYAGDVRLQSPLISALSDVVVSKLSKFVCMFVAAYGAQKQRWNPFDPCRLS